MCIRTRVVLPAYSNVYDIEITISTVQSLISGFVMRPSIIHGKVINWWRQVATTEPGGNEQVASTSVVFYL